MQDEREGESVIVRASVTRVEAPPVMTTGSNACPTYGPTERAARAFLTALVGKDRVIQVTGTAWGVLTSDIVAAMEKRKAAGAPAPAVPQNEDDADGLGAAGLRVVGGRR